MSSIRHYILLIFLFVNWIAGPGYLMAQSVPPLDRLITVDIRNATVENALRQISRVGHFEFSYNPSRIEGSATVSVRMTNAPVREVLNQVFQNRITYKSRGNYVILVRADVPDATPKNFLLDGYILDEQTGERIAQASIFEKTTLASTVSNPFGYYRLRLPTNLPAVRLDVRKQAYMGETVIIRSRVSHSVSIRMTPQPLNQSLVQPLPIRVTEDTTRAAEPLATRAVETPTFIADSTPKPRSVSVLEQGRQGITRLFVSAQQAIHDVNLSRDTLYRDWQVSFLPFIGTNHRLSGRISNRISVNVLVGYSFGVRAFEAGGLLNLVRTDVRGFQAGGLGNVVGGQMKGAQFGGLFNFTNGELINAFQAGGLLNIAGRSVSGVQLAGLVNYTQRDVRGWQISGVLNRARTVTGGHQLGLINIADSAGNVPFGLLNHVQKGGYRRIEVAANEVNLLNVTYRTGVRRFYSILSAGSSFERVGSPKLSAGYGLGTGFRLSQRTLLGVEASYHHLFYFDRSIYANDDWNNHLRLSTLVEAKFSNHLSLAFGPSVNWYFSNDGTAPPLLQPSIPLFPNSSDAPWNGWGWIGFQVGLRFGNS